MENIKFKIICAILAIISVASLVGFIWVLNEKTNLFGSVVITARQGGTGTGTSPSQGQVLVGQSDGSYAPQATSTLGISGSGAETDPIWASEKDGYITTTTAEATLLNYLTTAAATLIYQPIGSYLTSISGLNISLLNNDVGYVTSTSGTSGLFYEDDFFACPNTTASLYRSVGPFLVQPLGNGGFGAYTTTLGDSNHPGVCSIVDSTTQNTGALVGARSLSTILSGGESVSVVFKIPSDVFTSSTISIGFHDIFDQNDAVDGNYFRMEAGTSTMYVKSANNSTRATGTAYTLSADTWYRATVTINSNATAANYYLYSSTGTQILSDTLTTVPSTTNRYVGFGISATEPTTSAAGPIVFIDYMSYSQPSPIR